MGDKVERSHPSAIRLEGQCFLSVYTSVIDPVWWSPHTEPPLPSGSHDAV